MDPDKKMARRLLLRAMRPRWIGRHWLENAVKRVMNLMVDGLIVYGAFWAPQPALLRLMPPERRVWTTSYSQRGIQELSLWLQNQTTS
jgi:hypothetical protein